MHPATGRGLSRYTDVTGIDTDYFVVELANRMLGADRQQRFAGQAKRGGIESMLLSFGATHQP